jgi:glycosyltransferase involved in cell wall biosynthesis
MNLVQITPGAGGMYCGGCLRDNALVAALRKLGHDALLVPLYLPLTLDEPDQSAGTPIFYGGINVFLEQKSALFRRAPDWLRRLLATPALLRRAAGKAAKTRAADVGELTLSMARGEEGHQARELDALVAWLKTQHCPDVVCLSNALLAGLARRLKAELRAPVVCLLSGEDTFLDALPASVRDRVWETLAARCRDVDCFIAPSRYFADLMTHRLRLPSGSVRVVPNGINLEGYGEGPAAAKFDDERQYRPVIGYFARMCREKGLDTLVEAFLLLKRRPEVTRAQLHVGGGCGPADAPFVQGLKQKLAAAGVLGDARFFPNVDRAGKLEFFRGLSVFSVPALYGEAFGLYVIEALAAGVPVVQPRHAAFPELIEATGGGLLCEPGDPQALADALETLLLRPLHARHLGQRGQQAVREKFSAEQMARRLVEVLGEVKR